MANPSVQKRERERAQQERQREKDAKRLTRRDDKPVRSADGEDPDLAGIVPGPQPIPDDD
jgi:hypothetical protein